MTKRATEWIIPLAKVEDDELEDADLQELLDE